MRIPTVKVCLHDASPEDWMIINESDFDADKYVLATEVGKPAKPTQEIMEQAKNLGIRNAHLMKPETLEQKIVEAESGVHS